MAKRSCYRQKGLNDFVRSLFHPPKNIYHYFIEIFFEGKNNSLFFFFRYKTHVLHRNKSFLY